MKKRNFVPALVIVGLSIPTLSFAADDPVLGEGWQVGAAVYEILKPLLAAGLLWLTTRISFWITAKVKNEKLQSILVRTHQSLSGLIQKAEKTMVAEYKKAKAPDSPGGAKLTKSEADVIKASVISEFKIMWGPKGWAELGKILGLNAQNGVDTFIEGKLEELVEEKKLRAKVA